MAGLSWPARHGFLRRALVAGYARLTTASRVIFPLLILAAIAALLVAPKRGRASAPGLLLVLFLVAQSLLLGALPRLALPFLPALLLLGVVALAELEGAARRLGVVAIFALLVAASPGSARCSTGSGAGSKAKECGSSRRFRAERCPTRSPRRCTSASLPC